jgi:hypothetical protein
MFRSQDGGRAEEARKAQLRKHAERVASGKILKKSRSARY